MTEAFCLKNIFYSFLVKNVDSVSLLTNKYYDEKTLTGLNLVPTVILAFNTRRRMASHIDYPDMNNPNAKEALLGSSNSLLCSILSHSLFLLLYIKPLHFILRDSCFELGLLKALNLWNVVLFPRSMFTKHPATSVLTLSYRIVVFVSPCHEASKPFFSVFSAATLHTYPANRQVQYLSSSSRSSSLVPFTLTPLSTSVRNRLEADLPSNISLSLNLI